MCFEIKFNFKGCLFDFFRAQHNGWSGFCQDFWRKIRSVCDVVKPLGFQGNRNLILNQNLYSLDKFHKGISNAIQTIYDLSVREVKRERGNGMILALVMSYQFFVVPKNDKGSIHYKPLKMS